MLSGHSHIRQIQINDGFFNNRIRRRLVVDTDLLMPPSGRIEESEDLLVLHNYLEHLAANNFADVHEVTIRTPMPAPCKTMHEAMTTDTDPFQAE
ncbi:MAG: hypothetical protein WC989_06140 [Micavibrio sp.]